MTKNMCAAGDCYSFVKCMFGLKGEEGLQPRLRIDLENDSNVTIENAGSTENFVFCKSYAKSSKSLRLGTKKVCRLKSLSNFVELEFKYL